MEWKIGDVVLSIIGGPHMAVSKVDNGSGMVLCIYWDEVANKFETCGFHALTLKAARDVAEVA